jgi:uncharacterized protein DUF6624
MRMLLLLVALAACRERSLAAPDLRVELLAMMDEDQAARGTIVERDGMLVSDGDVVERVDRKTMARMKEIVAAHGWPGKSLVGEDGAHAAWLLVQHADDDRVFQKLCLDKMAALLGSGEILARDYAYLYDRVALGTGKKQRYGTQWDNDYSSLPLEDPEHVDERRASMGLGTLAEGKREMLEKYRP